MILSKKKNIEKLKKMILQKIFFRNLRMCELFGNGIGIRRCVDALQYLRNMEEQVLETIIVLQQEAIRSRRVAFELEPKTKKNSHGLKRREEFFIGVMRRNYGSQCNRTETIVMKHMGCIFRLQVRPSAYELQC